LTLLQCGGDGCGGNVDDQQQRIYCGMYLNNGEFPKIDTLSIAGLISTLTRDALLIAPIAVAVVTAISFALNITTAQIFSC
jgi:hypothetical protein